MTPIILTTPIILMIALSPADIDVEWAEPTLWTYATAQACEEAAVLINTATHDYGFCTELTPELYSQLVIMFGERLAWEAAQ